MGRRKKNHSMDIPRKRARKAIKKVIKFLKITKKILKELKGKVVALAHTNVARGRAVPTERNSIVKKC